MLWSWLGVSNNPYYQVINMRQHVLAIPLLSSVLIIASSMSLLLIDHSPFAKLCYYGSAYIYILLQLKLSDGMDD